MKATNKTKTITLVSQKKQTLRLRLSIVKYEILKRELENTEVYLFICFELNRWRRFLESVYNPAPHVFSLNQCRKIRSCLSGDDCFDKIEEFA